MTILRAINYNLGTCYRKYSGRSQDGRGIGWGDHFPSYKFIERTIELLTKFTKKLLIASSGHQESRKATRCLRREVGQNIKDKKGDKRARDGDPSREGSLNRGNFQSPETLVLAGLREVFPPNWEEKLNKAHRLCA